MTDIFKIKENVLLLKIVKKYKIVKNMTLFNRVKNVIKIIFYQKLNVRQFYKSFQIVQNMIA